MPVRRDPMFARALRVAATLCAVGAGAAACAGEAAGTLAQPTNEIQLFVENDMFAGTDRYYTNGLKLGLGVAGETLLGFLREPSEALFHLLAAPDAEPRFGVFLGQNLYTPRDIRVAAAQPGDRPWAAWLYVGGVAQRARERRLDSVELDIGVVGPAALGGQVQSRWHELIGSPQPRGWQHQIPNEPAFVVSYLHKRKFGASTGVELIPHAGAMLGSVMTLARVGAMLRAGRGMAGFGPDTIEPGGAMLQSTRAQAPCAGWQLCEWYGFVAADLRLVGRNIFLDGPLFRAGPSVGRRRYVHDLSVGVAARIDRVRVSVTRVRRSEEFTTAWGGGGTQQFTSLNVGLEF